jgi:hypothetical protein
MFFRLELKGDDDGKINNNMQISVTKAGGYLVMVSKKDEVPKLLDNDFIFPTGYDESLQNTYQVKASSPLMRTGRLHSFAAAKFPRRI